MKFLKFSIVLFLFVVLSSSALAANILFVFTGGNLSHKTGIWPLVIALADRGHQITFLSSVTKIPQSHANVTDLAPKGVVEFSKEVYGINRIEARKKYEERKMFEMYDGYTFHVCKLLLKEPELQDLFENGSFDLVVINAVLGECGFLIANHFGSKYIISSSTIALPWLYGIFGIPNEASAIPHMAASFKFPMGILDRMLNVYYQYFWSDRDTQFVTQMDSLMKENFKVENRPSFSEMEKNASLVFLNSHPALDFARSLPPLFVEIGGMSIWDPVGKLPQEFQEYIDGAEEGVVLITFGSTMDLSTLPPDYLNMFYNMMNKFNKVRFIWRWSAEIPENQPANLKSAKWLPQREVLAHPKTKAFVTHCGINGVTEATYYGVPLIAMPFFADQDTVGYRIAAQEVGLLLEARGLTQEILDSVFHEILSNPKYKKNMETRSRIFKDRPETPTEKAVYWTEFVLRHDDLSSLKSMGMKQSLITRNLLDVYLISFLIFVVIPLVLLYLLIALAKNFVSK